MDTLYTKKNVHWKIPKTISDWNNYGRAKKSLAESKNEKVADLENMPIK